MEEGSPNRSWSLGRIPSLPENVIQRKKRVEIPELLSS